MSGCSHQSSAPLPTFTTITTIRAILQQSTLSPAHCEFIVETLQQLLHEIQRLSDEQHSMRNHLQALYAMIDETNQYVQEQLKEKDDNNNR